MCITGGNSMMDTDEDDKFEAQVARYNVHFKALMALIPISQHEEEPDSDEDDNQSSQKGKGKQLKKGKNSAPPGGKYGSKASNKLKNQYKHGMSRADAIKTKQKARKQSKAKEKQEKLKGNQEKFKGKPDKYKGKHRPAAKKN